MHVGCDAHAVQVRDFGGEPLFDRNGFAARDGQVESRNGRGHIKRHAIFARQDGDLVGANFVRCVAIRCDAVRSDNDCADITRFQKMTNHIVGDQGEGNAGFVQLPGRQAAPWR